MCAGEKAELEKTVLRGPVEERLLKNLQVCPLKNKLYALAKSRGYVTVSDKSALFSLPYFPSFLFSSSGGFIGWSELITWAKGYG